MNDARPTPSARRASGAAPALAVHLIAIGLAGTVGCSTTDWIGTLSNMEVSGTDGGDPSEECAFPPPATDDAGVLFEIVAGMTSGRPELGLSVTITNVAATSPGSRCAVETIGQCEVRDCRSPADQPINDGLDVAAIDAGEIRVLADGFPDIVFESRANGSYLTRVTPDSRPAVGACIGVRAVGSVAMGPFETVTQMPAALELTAPLLHNDPNAYVDIDRNAPLLLEWKPVDTDVMVRLGQRATHDLTTTPAVFTGLQIRCTFDGSGGAGTVPTAVLQRFASADDAAAPNTSGGITLASLVTTATRIGSLRVVAIGDAVSWAQVRFH